MKLIVVSAILLAACDGGGGGGALGEQARGERETPPDPPAAEAPFVVFKQPQLFIGALERPVEAPVTVGSTPSPDLMQSSDPSVVSVDAHGALVAHRNGQAVILGDPAGSPLLVQVNAAGPLRLDPERLVLAPGASGRLRVYAGGGELPADQVTWMMTDPVTAFADDGQVRAGGAPGQADVVVEYGGVRATANVIVKEVRR